MINESVQAALDAALRRCGSSWTAARVHGLICSRLAATGPGALDEWLRQVLQHTDPENALGDECIGLLQALYTQTHEQLSDRQSAFTLLLPGDGESAAVRAQAMAQWCEGYLHGLVSQVQGERLRRRLAAEPLSDIIRDLLQITRAVADEDDDDEGSEAAYTELLEYLRVAAQLVYEELADLRGRATGEGDAVRQASRPG